MEQKREKHSKNQLKKLEKDLGKKKDQQKREREIISDQSSNDESVQIKTNLQKMSIDSESD